MKYQTAVKAIIAKDGKFLLLKQHVEEKDFFTLPGGRVSSEDYEKELKREVREETGLEIDIIRYIGEWEFIRESNGNKTVCKTFLCSSHTHLVDQEGSKEYERILDHKWISKDEFLNGDYSDNESLRALVAEIEI